MRKSDMRAAALLLAAVGAWFARADRLVPILDASLDAARPARGISLSFLRSYATSTNSCYRKGLLGYGWADNLTACFRREGPDILVFPSPPGDEQAFVEAKNKWYPVGPGDTTALSETSDAYVLKYENGVTRSFSKESSRTSFIQNNQGNSLVFTWQGNELQRVAHADGQCLTFTYANGLMTSVTDDCGRKTEFRYSDDYLVGVKSHDGRETKYEYDYAGTNRTTRTLSRVIRPDGAARSFAYDNSGRVSAISEGSADGKSAVRKTTITRSDDGVAVVVAPDGGRSVLKFGKRGEVLQTTDALGNARRYAYSTNGLLESITAPSGGKVSVEHDKRGRIAALVAASGAKTKFSYAKPFGGLARVTDANGQDLLYDYDSLGRATSVTFPDGSSSRLSYNARGDMTESRNRRAQVISRICDAQGRVIRMTWPDGRSFQYSYDARGNLVMAQDSETGVVMMSYDKNDRMTRVAYPGGRGLEFAYDSLGRLVSRKLFGCGKESTAVEKFTYDAEGRLASLLDGNVKSYLVNDYDANTGRLAKQTYGNGTVVSNAYDCLGRITGIYHCRAVSEKSPHLAFFEYTYDADGRCIASRSQEGWETYAYDADGQLIAAFYPNGTKDTFSYDAVGNRKVSGGSPSQATVTYAVNSLNQYTSVTQEHDSPATIAYDLDGNMVSQKDEKGEARYFYDALNRLVAVTNEEAGVRWSCKYDALGNRVSVTDNGVTTGRVLIPGVLSSVAAEFVGGKLTKRHIVAGAVHIATLTTDHSTSTTTYYHGDIIGSVRLVTDKEGREISRNSYSAFGSPREGRAPARPSFVGYVGMLGVETDPTGLLFMRNRYYSPNLGRFITPDPIGLAGGDVNWYRYCGNEPIAQMDCLGLFSLSEAWEFAKQEAGLQNGVLNPLSATQVMTEKAVEYGGNQIVVNMGNQISQLGDKGLRPIGRGLVELTAKEGRQLEQLQSTQWAGGLAKNAGLLVGVASLATDFLPAVLSGEWDAAADITRRWALRRVLEPIVMAEEAGAKLGEVVAGARSYDRKKKAAQQRRNSGKPVQQPKKELDNADNDDDELSPDQIPDPDNDNYVWCEDVCGEEGLRFVCPEDTSHCIYWGCSRCGHVIRRKARKAKRQERIWKAQGKDCLWHGSQFDIRQAKSAD